jgi:cell wall-associated NlpC family hydrolase
MSHRICKISEAQKHRNEATAQTGDKLFRTSKSAPKHLAIICGRAQARLDVSST